MRSCCKSQGRLVMDNRRTRFSIAEHDDLSSEPMLIDLRDRGGRQAWEDLHASGRVWRMSDPIRDQLQELLRCRTPGRRPSEGERACEVSELLGDTPERYGVWIYYPWSGALVHVLRQSEFTEVRSDRNRFKISGAEQDALGDKKIGVVGLSVGNAAALSMCLEGIGGEFRLADPDTLSLSNLNRLRARADEI